MISILPHKKLVLASKSPRRKQLLKDLRLDFSTRTKEVKESYPNNLQGAAIAEFLAAKKAEAFADDLADDEIVITSDTVVWCNKESLAKAQSKEEATLMLRKLSGKTHQVITGVCLYATDKKIVFSDTTEVCFKNLSNTEIDFYISQFSPFDKAGAYGIQEWIGMVGITSIKGSYFTVMGLPTHLVYQHLRDW